MLKLTKEELKKFDGKDGRKAYIAYKGTVYDVTDSFLWKDGKHFITHSAGQDLTEEIDLAPHGPELLSRVPRIGHLLDD